LLGLNGGGAAAAVPPGITATFTGKIRGITAVPITVQLSSVKLTIATGYRWTVVGEVAAAVAVDAVVWHGPSDGGD